MTTRSDIPSDAEKHLWRDWNNSGNADGTYSGVWRLRDLIDLPRPDNGEIVWLGATDNGECQTLGVVEDVGLNEDNGYGWAKIRLIEGARWRHFDENGVVEDDE